MLINLLKFVYGKFGNDHLQNEKTSDLFSWKFQLKKIYRNLLNVQLVVFVARPTETDN